MSELVSILSSTALVVLVAVLLRNLLGGSPAPAEPADAAMRDLASVLQSQDLTVPRTQELAVMVLYLPDYPRLIRERPLEQVFAAINLFYRVATEIADRHKGEVASLVGGEICVLFGRILPVESPLHTAAASALAIVARYRADLPPELAAHVRGASAAVTAGAALSGPVGGEWRRTYATVGLPVDDARGLVRAVSPNEVRVPAELAPRLAAFELDLADSAATTRRVLAERPPAPPASEPAPPA